MPGQRVAPVDLPYQVSTGPFFSPVGGAVSDRYLRPRNWPKFQHYKERQPPWIKLHRALLRDHDFTNLTELQQLHLMKLWLLYSDIGRPLPWDCGWIAAQLKANPAAIGKTLKALESFNYIELCDKNASVMLAPCKQSASPETETYREETETDPPLPPQGGDGDEKIVGKANGLNGETDPNEKRLWRETFTLARENALEDSDVYFAAGKLRSKYGKVDHDWLRAFIMEAGAANEPATKLRATFNGRNW